jgi:hypothetical protein
MLEQRKSSRIKMVLSVTVSLDTVTYLAHTIDITHTGARIGGLRAGLQSGMIISLQRGSHKAKFRIAWTRQVAPNELQAGVESLELQNNFWGIAWTQQAAPNEIQAGVKNDVQALMTILSSCSKPRI